MAAYGCMRALSTVLDSVSSMSTLFPELEAILFPLMQRLTSTEGQDVFEEVLELISYFTYFSPSVRGAPPAQDRLSGPLPVSEIFSKSTCMPGPQAHDSIYISLPRGINCSDDNISADGVPQTGIAFWDLRCPCNYYSSLLARVP